MSEFESRLQEEHRLQPKTHLQPRVYIVGDDNVKAVVTTVTHQYHFDDPISAVNCCFHIFLGLDAQYPRQSDHLWEFLQKAVYELKTPHDINYITTDTFISDISRILI